MNEVIKGRLHSIETMGLVDGPGTRTIFFLQGCPIRCTYCHNPDTQDIEGGREITPEEVLKIAKRYRNYHGEDGGVTFSGGEPLLQGKFLYKSLELLKEDGFTTAVDTSGFGNKRYYGRIFPLVDTLLLDVKAFSEKDFYNLTKGSFKTYRKFVEDLEKNGFRGQIWIRHVMVPGYTDNEESMKSLVEAIEPIKKFVERIEILPYHTAGIQKYEELGREYELEGVESMNHDVAKEYEKLANKLFATMLHVDDIKEKTKSVGTLKSGHPLTNREIEDATAKLRGLTLLQDLAPADMDRVINEEILLKVNADEFIFKTGDQASYMYVILEGQVKIYYNSIDGKEQIFYIYKSGDYIGGLNLLENTSYLYMGQALTECIVAAIPRDVFHENILTNPTALKNILKKSFERIRWAEDLIQRLSTSNASMKTAGLLLRLKNTNGVVTKEGIRLDFNLNREELGSYSGLTRESITRKLGEFKELGYIELIGNRTIIIKDLKAIEDYVF